MYIPLLFIGILPFIQIGLSYYASVGVLGALMLLWYQRKHLPLLLERLLLVRLAVVALMVVLTWGYPASGADVLRAFREAVFYFLLTGCVGWSLHQGRRDVADAASYARLFLAGMLVLTLLQTLFLSRGVYFGLPQALFTQNASAIAGELDLYYSDIRPNGSYGEPSYLGGVCLCMLFAFSPLLLKQGRANQNTGLALATVILSRSFSGVVFYLLMLFASLWRLVGSFATRVALVAGIITVCTLVLTTENTVSSRLDRLRSGEDSSSMARVFQPMVLIPDLLTKEPTGIPMSRFMNMGYISSVGAYAEELTHNALLNLILNYGWAGLLAIAVWLCALPDLNSRIFILLLSMQNGAVLTPDKFLLIALSMMIYNTCRAAAARTVTAPVAPQPASRHNSVDQGYRPIRDVLPWK